MLLKLQLITNNMFKLNISIIARSHKKNIVLRIIKVGNACLASACLQGQRCNLCVTTVK